MSAESDSSLGPAVETAAAPMIGSAGRERGQSRAAVADDLAIAGLVPLSSVDWPGRLAATVFCQGCPWRCTYCHNQAILDPRTPGAVPFAQLEALLERRRGLLDGVVFSGGEATAQHALLPAVRRVRQLGFAVGLHTGGAYPPRLRELLGLGPTWERIAEPLVDWVGFDVKAAPYGYEALVGRRGSWRRAEESLWMLLTSGIDHELRTTVTPGLVAQLPALLRMVAGVGGDRLVLQPVRADGADAGFASTLPQDWPARFQDAVTRAADEGAALGLTVTARAA